MFSGFWQIVKIRTKVVQFITKSVLDELREIYPECLVLQDGSLSDALSRVKNQTGQKFVIIIDEWDCVIRNSNDQAQCINICSSCIHFLNQKNRNRFLALGYITGILPIKKIKDESALNNFQEYTMLKSRPITEYYGFTEDEVKELCQKYDMDFETMKAWYNGYLIDGMHMYNPILYQWL